MKKLLSLIGAMTITVSGTSSAVVAVRANVTISSNEGQNENKLNSGSNDLKTSYNALPLDEKTDVAIEMTKLSELSINEISQYLSNSNVTFIRNNQTAIENMYLLYNSFEKISNSLAITTQTLDFDWIKINEFIDLGFGDSNNYTPSLSTYGPAYWWTAIWDWGWQIDFPEGDINIMRIVKLVISLYDDINFAPLESLLNSGKNLFDYLVNLDQHDEDKISVLYDLMSEIENEFKKSGVPFTNKVYEIFDTFSSILEPLKNLKLQVVKNIIKLAVEKELGMSLEEIGIQYASYLNLIVNVISIANDVLDIIQDSLPAVVWNFIVDSISIITNQMINADENHNGVYLKFQQFIIPLGFEAR